MTEPRDGSPAPRGASQRAVAALVVALALVTGLVGGVAIDRGVFLRHRSFAGARWEGPRGAAGHGQPSDRMRGWFARELALTPTQVTQVDSIMSRHMAERRAIADSMGAKMHTLLDSTRAEVDRILTPEQRQKFAALRARQDSMMAHRAPWRARPDRARESRGAESRK